MRRRPTTPDAKAFLGRGWAFRSRVDAHGAIALAEYEEDIRQAIRIILDTEPGERVMRPDFGAGLRALVFEPINTHDDGARAAPRRAGAGAVGAAHRQRRRDGERRSAARAARRSRSAIACARTNTFYNLVYPFYLQEGRSGALSVLGAPPRRAIVDRAQRGARSREPRLRRSTVARLRAPRVDATRGDAGDARRCGALHAILARYLEIQGDGLNAMPLRLQLEFLDSLGASVLPAQPARAPLVFKLLDTASGDATVPAGTRVGRRAAAARAVARRRRPRRAPPRARILHRAGDHGDARQARRGVLDRSAGRHLRRPQRGARPPASRSSTPMEPVPHRLYLGHGELFRSRARRRSC